MGQLMHLRLGNKSTCITKLFSKDYKKQSTFKNILPQERWVTLVVSQKCWLMCSVLLDTWIYLKLKNIHFKKQKNPTEIK